MAERLTKCDTCFAYTTKDNVKSMYADIPTLKGFFDNDMVVGNAIDKLATFEDIMDKYDINSFKQLDKYLADFDTIMKRNKFQSIEELQNAINGKFQQVFDEKNKIWQNIVKKLTKAEKDRDTWKKACELACEEIDCECMYGVDKENYSQYFYQQAKTEENDDN